MMPEFLTVGDCLTIHAEQIRQYGGKPGVRDLGLLESAVAQPEATFGEEYLHHDLFEMAAAYLFHIVRNHPFVDGNKRVGLVAALVFLDINNVVIETGTDQLYTLTMAVAEGNASKLETAAELRRLVE